MLDPFTGSGTTAISAINSDRKFVGYEISEEYISLAEKRMKQRQKITAVFAQQNTNIRHRKYRLVRARLQKNFELRNNSDSLQF